MLSKGNRILIVDDDRDTRIIFSDVLTAKGYEVVLTKSGEEALQKIEQLRPDLILLDARLPDYNGVKICQRIKNNPSFKSIPILMITASTDPEFKKQILDVCPDEVLTKPIKPHELLAKIKSYLDEGPAFLHPLHLDS